MDFCWLIHNQWFVDGIGSVKICIMLHLVLAVCLVFLISISDLFFYIYVSSATKNEESSIDNWIALFSVCAT